MPAKVHSGYRPRRGSLIETEFRLIEALERERETRRLLVRTVGSIGAFLTALPSDKGRALARMRAEYAHCKGLE